MANKQLTIKNIVPAALFARTFGAIIDLIITIFVGAGVFLGLSNIAYQMPAIKQFKDHYYQEIVDSGLMKLEDAQLVPYEYSNYEQYETLFYSFYHEYYGPKKNTTYDVYWFNVFIYGQDDALNRYGAQQLSSRPSLIRTLGKQLFTYRTDESNLSQYNSFALPIASNNGTENLTNAEIKQLINYFYVADREIESNPLAQEYRYVYFYALADLTSLPELKSDYDNFAFFGTTLPLAIAIFITFMVFYLLIPLCFKNGQSIGKVIMKTCLVNKLGYQYNRLQLIPRVLFPTFLTMALIVLMGLSLYPFIIISIFVLASFVMVVFSKNHLAFHDYFAGTIVIDARSSTWFKDAESETKAQNEIDDFVATVKHDSN